MTKLALILAVILAATGGAMVAYSGMDGGASISFRRFPARAGAVLFSVGCATYLVALYLVTIGGGQ